MEIIQFALNTSQALLGLHKQIRIYILVHVRTIMFKERRVPAVASRDLFLQLMLASGLYFSSYAYVPSGSALDYVFSSPKHTLSALAFDNRSIVSEESFTYLHSATSCRYSSAIPVHGSSRFSQCEKYLDCRARAPNPNPAAVSLIVTEHQWVYIWQRHGRCPLTGSQGCTLTYLLACLLAYYYTSTHACC